MTNISRAIIAINADARFKTTNNDPDNIEWLEGTTPISNANIQAKVVELTNAETAELAKKATDKANAKAKLISGETLTADEADTIVL